ncbi:MAG: AraC family transcriptional regulator, partial [Duncaniella sp.]|nr:AraC family transcriptional regulator [Duncaniella sp.]
VYDIREDAYGRLWVATFGDGVKCCPDPEAERPVLSPSLGGRKVRKLLLTPAGNIVAATTDGLLAGLIEQNWADTRLRLISRDGCDAGSLSSNTIISLAQDSRGDIYIATESSGVDVISEKALFDDKPLFRHLDIPSAAISIAITVMDDSTVVIVGHDHVTLYNLLSGGSVCLNRAFWGESCHFSETTPLRLPDGAWLFGAEEGAFVVTPEEIAALDYVPNIVFTTLSVGGGPARFGVVPHDSLTLPAGSRNVSVGYAALDYVDNSGILYRTRFDGSAWSGAGPDRSLTLFNLSPGCHLLEVESTDRFGRWTGNVRSLSLYVTPFWYETWWARTLAAMLCVSLVAAVVLTWLYIRRINRQRRELLEKYMDAIASRHVAVAAPDSGDTVEGIPAVVSRHRPEDVAFLGRVRRYIEDNISNPDAGVDEMAAAAAVSRSTLNRRLRSLLGVSSSRLLMEARMQHAVKLIETAEVLDIAEIAEGCGYTDAHYFSRVFRNKFGVLPADYGKDSSAL